MKETGEQPRPGPGGGRLSGRERQIMEVIYAHGQATVSQVHEGLPDPPTRTAVRTLLRILEGKGYIRHSMQGREFIYEPCQERQHAGQSALRRLLATFFDNSLERALAQHLADPQSKLSSEELDRLAKLIRKAKKGE